MVWRVKAAIVPIVCLPFAAACTTVDTGPGPSPYYVPVPIVALAADDVGIVASATPQSQGASLTVGYKGAKVAVLPVEGRDGRLLGLQTGPKETETYSIFTQLGLDARAGASTGVAVEQVLAIGPAADAWAKNAKPFPSPSLPAVPGSP
jgi:hypothetical protein